MDSFSLSRFAKNCLLLALAAVICLGGCKSRKKKLERALMDQHHLDSTVVARNDSIKRTKDQVVFQVDNPVFKTRLSLDWDDEFQIKLTTRNFVQADVSKKSQAATSESNNNSSESNRQSSTELNKEVSRGTTRITDSVITRTTVINENKNIPPAPGEIPTDYNGPETRPNKLGNVLKYYQAGQYLYYQKDYQRALKYIDSSLTLMETADGYGFKGSVYYTLGDKNKARYYWNKAKSLDQSFKIPVIREK